MLNISSNSHLPDKHYKQRLQSAKALHTPKNIRVLVRVLTGVLLLFLVVMFLPWQQNIRAEGELTALSPKDRPQTIETPIDGRIEEWMVQEGQLVDSGQVLLVISEIKDKFFDPQLLDRTRQQIAAKERSISAKQDKATAKEEQLLALREQLGLKLQQTEQKIQQYQLKVVSDSNDWVAAKVDLRNYKRQYQANQAMYDSGLISLVKLEAARSKLQEGVAKEISYQNKYLSTKNELAIARLELSGVMADARDKIAKTESERSATVAEITDSEGDLIKARNEYANLEVRSGMRIIRAPQRGYVVKALKSGIGETVKANSALMTLMPEKPQLAVALYVKAMDVPLLSLGRHVRLRFDGWPALQFSGWPSVSVGTFGGKIQTIDYVNSKEGKYRILVVPDARNDHDHWPAQLRVGSGVYGWAMLDEVPIWYEIWRNLNGFPPSLKDKPEEGDDKKKDGGKTDEE